PNRTRPYCQGNSSLRDTSVENRDRKKLALLDTVGVRSRARQMPTGGRRSYKRPDALAQKMGTRIKRRLERGTTDGYSMATMAAQWTAHPVRGARHHGGVGQPVHPGREGRVQELQGELRRGLPGREGRLSEPRP